MDPTANLDELLAEAIAVPEDDPAARMAELILALNAWIGRGGFLPYPWQTQQWQKPTETEEKFEQMRQLLIQWESYARTLADSGIIALPEALHNRTVGILDATAV
jgi:hypothetical protein